MTLWHLLRLQSSKDGLKEIFHDIRSRVCVFSVQIQFDSCGRLHDGRT